MNACTQNNNRRDNILKLSATIKMNKGSISKYPLITISNRSPIKNEYSKLPVRLGMPSSSGLFVKKSTHLKNVKNKIPVTKTEKI